MRRSASALLTSSLIAGAGVAGMVWAVRGRSSTVFGPCAWRGKPGRNAIALTFDDGPSRSTPQILDILRGYGVPATFFQCGEHVNRARELSRAMRDAGHEIGNHSHTHPNFAFARPSFIEDEFRRAQDAISEATLTTPALMRPPYGVRWFGFPEMQRRLGLLGVMWSVIGRDWKLAAPAIAERVISHAEDGGIICLHDGRGSRRNPDIGATVEAVRRIVPSMLAKGYHFVTVSQLLWPKT